MQRVKPCLEKCRKKMAMKQNNDALRQSGNALFMVLIGVMLFAALSFTFSRGNQQGAENISRRQAELAASDIITFGQRVGRTVDSMISKNKSENQISFEGLDAGYANSNCVDDSCQVFKAGKYGIQTSIPSASWINISHSSDYAYLSWYVTAQFCIPGLPDATCSVPRGNELVLVLPYLKQAVCETINAQLGLPPPIPAPTIFGTINAANEFDGNYNLSGGAVLWDAAELNGISAACVSSSSGYHFYQVLLAR